jgi:hypothetical protein
MGDKSISYVLGCHLGTRIPAHDSMSRVALSYNSYFHAVPKAWWEINMKEINEKISVENLDCMPFDGRNQYMCMCACVCMYMSVFCIQISTALGVEFRVSHLLDMYSTTWVSFPAIFVLLIVGIGFHVIPHASLDHNPLIYVSCVAGITSMSRHWLR